MNLEDLNRRLLFLQPKRNIIRMADEIVDQYSSSELVNARQNRNLKSVVIHSSLLAAILAIAFWATLATRQSSDEPNGWKLTSTEFVPRKIEPLFLKNISAFKVSPDEQWIAFGDYAGHLRVMDYEFQTQLALPGCSSKIVSLCWSSDSKKIAVGTVDGSMIVFDQESGTQRVVAQLDTPMSMQYVTFVNHDRQLAALVGKQLVLVEVENARRQATTICTSAAWQMSADDDGNRLAILAVDGFPGVHRGLERMLIVDVSNDSISSFEIPFDFPDRPTNLAWSPDGSRLTAVDCSGNLNTWLLNGSSSQLVNSQSFDVIERCTTARLRYLDDSTVRVLAQGQVLDFNDSGLVQQKSLTESFQKKQNPILEFGRLDEFLFGQNGIGIVNLDGQVLHTHTGPYCASAERSFCVGSDSFVVFDSNRKLSLLENDHRTLISVEDEKSKGCDPAPATTGPDRVQFRPRTVSL